MEINALREAHPDHWQKACAIRVLTLDAVAAANSGHSGMPMGMADVATVLFGKHLKFDAANPDWPDRDRFVLSAGHGSMLLYSLLYLTDSPDMTLEQVKNFRQLGSITAGHPEYGHAKGIETTTGPLGQGIANSVGFAIAEEHLRATWGDDLVNHYTYVIAGDGCLMEGVSQEAIALAGQQQLSKLIVFWDDNGITIDGPVGIADRTDQQGRFAACGWHVQSIDGHDPDAIDRAIEQAKADGRPSMIACKTHIGLGSPAQDTSKAHGALTDAQLIADTRAVYGWEHGPFEIPGEIKAAWEEIGARGAAARADWESRLAAQEGDRRSDFERAQSGKLPGTLAGALADYRAKLIADKPKVATRKASEMALEIINPIVTETIGGSADLTGSNNTRTSEMSDFTANNRAGRYIRYGVREHGMAAAMNGLALHGGVRPYGGTFLCFTDYARPSMRLSALMGVPVVYVMTHDSIGLGEDGPTHQPVEHVAMLRATPNMLVFRPADVVETAEAWEIALEQTGTPSVLALSRQNLPTVRTDNGRENLTAKGAYILAEAEAKRQAILLATGSEVSLALEARDMLEAAGIGTRVVSVPCMELFEAQPEAYRKKVLPNSGVRVAIEAGVRQGWDRWLLGERARANKADFVGMTGFGASAPAEELYEHFGITAEATVAKVKALL
ncbi:transketolase [Tropicimonas isoalkanivorans]|uniref:transketolase n=1 Tax=Tropicimonas isoalkanivorans TaxID=441112 RepID=UPI000B87AF4C|nr:transketolase [Tropicimonas isoalkanivorans]